MSKEQPEALQLPTLPFAVFDEFGRPCEDRVRDHFAAAFEELRAQIGQGEPDGLFESQIEPRPLLHPLSDYHRAMTDGPLHYTWIDKPHRLVYDLIAAVRYYASAHTAPQQKPLTDELIKLAIYKQCPDFDDWHEGPSIDDVIAIVKAAHDIGEKK